MMRGENVNFRGLSANKVMFIHFGNDVTHNYKISDSNSCSYYYR